MARVRFARLSLVVFRAAKMLQCAQFLPLSSLRSRRLRRMVARSAPISVVSHPLLIISNHLPIFSMSFKRALADSIPKIGLFALFVVPRVVLTPISSQIKKETAVATSTRPPMQSLGKRPRLSVALRLVDYLSVNILQSVPRLSTMPIRASLGNCLRSSALLRLVTSKAVRHLKSV